MVLAERNSEIVRNGRRSRGPSPNNGHGGGATVSGSNTSCGGGGGGGAGTPETSSDDDNSVKRNGKSKTKQSEYEEKIRVGRDYQAVCPPLIPEIDRKPEILNDRALLVWSPTKEIPDPKLEEYISVAKEKYGYNGEQALGMLFWHKHDLERAVMDLANFTPFPDEWTVEDKVLFEQAFQFHGKSFHRIRQMLPDKSIASLVKYYYSWKKTRHRQSVMDRQDKAKASKEGSENGSENGSNEESDTEDKDQMCSTSGLQDQISVSKLGGSHGGVGGGDTAVLLTKQNKSNDIVVATAAAAAAAEIDNDSSINCASTNAANKQQQQQRQETPPNSNTDSSCTGRTTPTNLIGGSGGSCTNCGVVCNLLNASPQGKLCASCHHHWRRTGNKRPTSGPFLSKRSRDRNADRHKRKPPRGMYINHDDIIALANDHSEDQDQLLANADRELVKLLSHVQLNKQTVSQLKRKSSEGTEDLRPVETTNRINSRWSNDELLLAVEGVRKFGKDFQAIAETLGTKNEAHVRTFYVNYRRRYNLDQVLKKHEAEKEAAVVTAAASNETANNSNSNSNPNASTNTSSSNKKDEQKKREVTTTGAGTTTVADESDNTTSSETTISKSTNDELKSSSSNSHTQKDNIIMEIDLDAEQPEISQPAKKIALSVASQEFPKASPV